MTNAEVTKDLKEKLVSSYSEFEKSLNSPINESVHKKRLEAFEYFKSLGFPSRKNEEWRFTNIKPVIEKDYNPAFSLSVNGFKKKDIKNYHVKNFDASYLVFINGRFSGSLSDIKEKSDNFHVGSLRDSYASHGEIIGKHFAEYTDYKNDGFTALNTAYTDDGLFIYAKKGAVIEKPVIVINIAASAGTNAFINTRSLIVIEDGGYADVSNFSYSSGDNFTFTNAVTELVIGHNAELHYNNIQDEGNNAYRVETVQVSQKNDSRLFSNTISWGGSITRNNLNSYIGGRGIDCYFRGVYIVKGNRIIDNHTLADHAKPDSHSNELYKGILDDRGTAVFNGKILVRKDAQKTNAYQTNNNILLSDDAVINSKPQLEIFADDVKCSHGATTGQISRDEMFYLRSRGISENLARKILLYAYASSVITEIKNEPVREMLLGLLDGKL